VKQKESAMDFRSVRPKGAIAIRLQPPHPGAFTDALPCRWPDVTSEDDILVTLSKNPDRSLAATIHGVHGQSFVFQAVIPPCDSTGLHIVIRWDTTTVDLF
jgi:hypothetical protein